MTNAAVWRPRSAMGWVGFGAMSLLLIAAAFLLTSYALSLPLGVDVAAYWDAAMRLRQGEPLYAGGAANASDLYRYAPWFAYAWIPLTYLPREAVTIGWVGLMLAAAAASVLPLVRRGPTGVALIALLGPLQLQGAIFGNVQPLLVLALVWGVERRSGPLWVALTASLKLVPLLLVVTYALRGEWRRALLAVGLAAVLIAPTFLFDLSRYTVAPGPNQVGLAGVSVQLWLGVLVLAVAVAAALARTRFGWLAAAVAMLAALPRLLSYEFGLLLVGLAATPAPAPGQAVARRPTTNATP